MLLTSVLVALTLPACGRKGIHLPNIANQRPTVRLTHAPANSTDPFFYSYEIFWFGADADGQIDHYLYAIDPPSRAGAETSWVSTRETRGTFRFRSGDPDSLGTHANPGGFHVFVIKAVDNVGLESAPDSRAFFSFTAAPTVTFVNPQARPLLPPSRPPATTISWTGEDSDGLSSKRPLYYRYRLFNEGDAQIPLSMIQADPDSVRRLAAPTFAGWDSISGDTVTVSITNLTPGRSYVMAVVAFDEAGAYSSVFSMDGNLLEFLCDVRGFLGPRLTMSNDYFTYEYVSGGYNTDPTTFIPSEVPAGFPLLFRWSARPNPGAQIRYYRWALDIDHLDDETPRSNERTDLGHWSQWGLGTTSARVGPFEGASDEAHTFYVEVEDDGGYRSLGAVRCTVVRPTFTKDLLFVDDTRRWQDGAVTRSDGVLFPGGNWPSRAELDTFFFARGGVPWRHSLPGQLSSPGIFLGYDFDTLCTFARESGTVPLSLLARYRHIVWYSDLARDFTGPTSRASFPMPMLRAMNMSGQPNVLAIYSRMGGNLWLMGGGIAYNSMLPWNPGTDASKIVYSNATGRLVPGRFMYDSPHWRSELTIFTPGRLRINPSLAASWPGAPDYTLLPPLLREKSTATDPVPPLRGTSTFYATAYDGEYLTQPNSIVEDRDPDPAIDEVQSVLDTLYLTNGGFAPVGKPIMTYYHGADCGPVVMSGFPLWFFQRSHEIELADFVLQRIWGLTRAPVSRDP